MGTGHIRLHRSILESQVFAHPTALKIWVWCLCKASYKERFVPLKIGKGTTTINIKSGQFIFGRYKAEEELGIDGSTIYKWIQKFASETFDNMIYLESNNQYTIITISNWSTYQGIEETMEQPSNNQVTAEEQPSNSGVTTAEHKQEYKESKEYIECKESKEENRGKRFTPPSVEDVKNYIIEKKYLIDAEAFVAFYSSKGWKVGNSPMKDWKMALVTWTKRDNRNIQQGYGKIQQPSLNVNEKWKRQQ